MSNMPDERTTPGEKDRCLDILLEPEASSMRTSGGRDISFTKAILIIRNICDLEAVNIDPHVTLGQEGGTVQDVTAALSQKAYSSLSPGETASWDVYDLLIPAHSGSASKIHMFGYRAALNWRFELAAWAEYKPSGSSPSVKTPVSRWALRWSIANPGTGEVELTIEDLKG